MPNKMPCNGSGVDMATLVGITVAANLITKAILLVAQAVAGVAMQITETIVIVAQIVAGVL